MSVEVQRMATGENAGLLDAARAIETSLIATRRDIHAHPELGFEEVRTSALVAERLARLGLRPRTGVGRTGVVADLVGGRAGPTIALRADLDGLPVEELSAAPYRSVEAGRMHACGHDGHVAMLLGAAELLVARQGALAGRIRFLFQPAEELPPGGALAMIDEGALDGVAAAIGVHLWNPLPVGTLGVKSGAVMAAHDQLRIRLRGVGGHGGMPELSRDPIVGIGALVSALQTVVSRNVSPLDTAVLTIGTLRAGSAFNVIADEAEITGSIRTIDTNGRSIVHERIRAVAIGIAAALGLEADVDIVEFCPALENDAGWTEVARHVATGLVGQANVRADFRTTASEDFAFVTRARPGCFVFVGSGPSDGGHAFPHHHPSFDIEEESLVIGTAALTGMAIEGLRALAADTKMEV